MYKKENVLYYLTNSFSDSDFTHVHVIKSSNLLDITYEYCGIVLRIEFREA